MNQNHTAITGCCSDKRTPQNTLRKNSDRLGAAMYCLAAAILAPAMLSAQSSNFQPGPVPAVYQDLYSELGTQLNAFSSEINAGWNQTPSPVAYSGQLMTANSDNGSVLITPGYASFAVQPELNQLQALGVKAVYVTINFPVLYQGYYTYAKSTSYQSYLNFYQQLAVAIHSRGMKMVVGNSATLTQGGLAGWNVSPYYSSLTLNQYEAGRAAQAATIASVVKPDYLSVVEEPDTEAAQTGFAAVGTLSGSTTMLTQILTAVHQAGSAGVQVGAGIGSWTPSYQSWFSNFAAVGAQYLDIHVFPINRTFLTQLPAMADYAASLGKPIGFSQCWLAKERSSELGYLPYGMVAARDPFSFWAPLDADFLNLMVKFSNWKHALFISPFWTSYFYGYTTYDPSYNSVQANQMLSQSQNNVMRNLTSGLHTLTGAAYSQAISGPPNTTPPTVPTGVTAVTNSNSIYLSWTPSYDRTGVAGYILYRNGVAIATTALTYFSDLGLPAGTSYIYSVAAYDYVANISAPSAPMITATRR